MCLRCLSRALKCVAAVEAAVSKTGGAMATTVQVVHHPHCRDPACVNEGHVHVRIRRIDNSTSDWVRANGTMGQFHEASRKVLGGLPAEVFDDLHEADERGLAPETLAVVNAVAAAGCARSLSEGECSICMEPLDCLGTVGGFVKLKVAALPCAHSFHLACYTKWAIKHTTCPCCRAEVSQESVAAHARKILPQNHPARRLPAFTRVAPAPTDAGSAPPAPQKRRSRLGRLFAKMPRFLPNVRALIHAPPCGRPAF